MKNTIVILGNAKDCKQLYAVLNRAEHEVKPFGFIGFEMTLDSQETAEKLLSEGYRVLAERSPELIGSIYLSKGTEWLGERYITFEGARAELIETNL